MYKLLTEKEISRLVTRANRGDEKSYNKLFKESKRVAKTSNTRLLRLEKTGFDYTSNAYQRATYYTEYQFGSERFRVNQSMSPDELAEQYREMRYFIEKPSSTISGIKKNRQQFEETLEEYGIVIPDNKKQKFYEVVNSDAVRDALQIIGTSDYVLDVIAGRLQRRGTSDREINFMIRQFENFNSGDITYDELLYRVGGKSLDDYYRQRHESRREIIDIRRQRRAERTAKRR